MTDRITDKQVQELTNHIADKCEAMGLEPEQIVDGIARALIAAADTFDFADLNVGIDNIGTCKVELVD
ncbi:hypothetical protein [Psychrosphaera aestuarii]|uniref:hypothetical protein n=1 Tax=Psychrosphaera aestuarii TaxID=1266052 RepID=UPI001B326D63|nr:hypothetical protein [Psychrosphaera aestuarii]